MRLPPFQNLLDAHGRDVHRFLIATVGQVDADDIYQETWLAALRAYPRLNNASNLRAWILTVAHRKAIDHLRARSRRPVPVAAAEEMADGDGSEEVLVEGESDVWVLVARLPDKQRTALALRFVADLAYAEIASAMDTSEEAARRSVHEGLKRLREDYRP